MRILLTGATGQIDQELGKALTQRSGGRVCLGRNLGSARPRAGWAPSRPGPRWKEC
jgi:hypothetical protein